MHFSVLLPLRIPVQEPNPETDTAFKNEIQRLREVAEQPGITIGKKIGAQIMAEKLTGQTSAFGRAVFKAVMREMENFEFEQYHLESYGVGRCWPSAFLVPDSCPEYSFGQSDGTDEKTKGPDGYLRVAAARKKDIAWDVINKAVREQNEAEFNEMLRYWESKKVPEDSGLFFTDHGIISYTRFPEARYVAGESLESFCARRRDCQGKYPVQITGYLTSYEYVESNESYEVPTSVEEAEADANYLKQWAEETDRFIDSLDDDTVLVYVDCNI